MVELFDNLSRVKVLITHGDVKGLHRAATAFSEIKAHGKTPEAWEKQFGRVRELGGKLSTASTIESASKITADILVECGACHRKEVPDLKFEAHHEPADADVMEKHALAVDGMWDGLVSGDESRFKAATQALLEVKLMPGDVTGPGPVPADTTALAERVKTSARAALAAGDWPTRAGHYAEVLATCGACHKR